MDGIAVDGVGIDLFVVVEDAVSPEGAGANDVTVGQDVTLVARIGQRKTTKEGTRIANPLSASTTKPVASLVRAGSVSKEQVWQNRMETTFRTTFSMVACHSAVSAPGARGKTWRGSSS